MIGLGLVIPPAVCIVGSNNVQAAEVSDPLGRLPPALLLTGKIGIANATALSSSFTAVFFLLSAHFLSYCLYCVIGVYCYQSYSFQAKHISKTTRYEFEKALKSANSKESLTGCYIKTLRSATHLL